MKAEADCMTIHMTYEDGTVSIVVDEGEGRRPYEKVFKNDTELSPRDFCVKTADQIEKDTGKSVRYSIEIVGKDKKEKFGDNIKQLTKNRPAISGVVIVLIIVIVSTPILWTFTNSPSSTSSSSADSISSSSSSSLTSLPTSSSYAPSYTPTEEKEDVFEFGEGKWDSNSSYIRYIGTVKNVSNRTRYFVKIRGSFKDESDNTIDTDWTYACGEEGLRPGESTKFTLSVMRDSRIKRVSYSVYDYD